MDRCPGALSKAFCPRRLCGQLPGTPKPLAAPLPGGRVARSFLLLCRVFGAGLLSLHTRPVVLLTGHLGSLRPVGTCQRLPGATRSLSLCAQNSSRKGRWARTRTREHQGATPSVKSVKLVAARTRPTGHPQDVWKEAAGTGVSAGSKERPGRDRGPGREGAFISGAELWGGKRAVEDHSPGSTFGLPGTFAHADGEIPFPLCGPVAWSVAPGRPVLKSGALGLPLLQATGSWGHRHAFWPRIPEDFCTFSFSLGTKDTLSSSLVCMVRLEPSAGEPGRAPGGTILWGSRSPTP